ncbi:MAG: HAD family hydrolase [Planctomycetaceae bacterium]
MGKRSPRNIKGVIFDLDGTLVDSMLDFDAMRRDMDLPEGEPILEALAKIPPGEQKDRRLAILREHELRGAKRATLMPGAESILKLLSGRGAHCGILTRNSREATQIVLQNLNHTFTSVLTREDAPAKPDPTGLLQICEQWQIAPGNALFVGDFLFDLQAGQRAGIPTVLYMPKKVPEYAELADFRIRHFDDLIPLIS